MIISTKPSSRRSLRSHKKSRNGCQRCKDRKIKCDEQRPICRTCSRRFGSLEPCVFDSSTSPPTEKASSSPPVPVPHPSYAMTFQPESKIRRWELRLFHHFTTCTATSMPNYGRAEIDQFWRVDMPRLSFRSDAVLSTVLGLAATHFLSNGSKDSEMKQSAIFYRAKGAGQLSSLVSELNKETAETVVLVAMLLVLQTRMRAVFLPDNEPYSLPLEYFYLHHGAEVLVLRSMSFLQNSNLLVAVGVEHPHYDPDPLYKEALSIRIWQDNLSLLEGTDVDGFDPQVKTHIEGALTYLCTIYMALLNGEDSQWTHRRLYAMPSHVSIGFVRLLEQHDARAMAILARFMALMKPCDGIWYPAGCAEYEVDGIASLMPPEWLWAMEWPRQILNSDVFGAMDDPAQKKCIETRLLTNAKVIIPREEFLARHRESRICLGEHCHCFQVS